MNAEEKALRFISLANQFEKRSKIVSAKSEKKALRDKAKRCEKIAERILHNARHR